MLFTEGGVIDKLAYEYIEQILLEYQGPDYANKIVYIRDSQTENDNFQVTARLPFFIQNGYTLILQNFHEIYSCLYDVLNQKYQVINGENFSNLFFGEYEEMIKIHPDFKCILFMTIDDGKRQLS